MDLHLWLDGTSYHGNEYWRADTTNTRAVNWVLKPVLKVHGLTLNLSGPCLIEVGSN